jgi:hypothetical protein
LSSLTASFSVLARPDPSFVVDVGT